MVTKNSHLKIIQNSTSMLAAIWVIQRKTQKQWVWIVRIQENVLLKFLITLKLDVYSVLHLAGVKFFQMNILEIQKNPFGKAMLLNSVTQKIFMTVWIQMNIISKIIWKMEQTKNKLKHLLMRKSMQLKHNLLH